MGKSTKTRFAIKTNLYPTSYMKNIQAGCNTTNYCYAFQKVRIDQKQIFIDVLSV